MFTTIHWHAIPDFSPNWDDATASDYQCGLRSIPLEYGEIQPKGSDWLPFKAGMHWRLRCVLLANQGGIHLASTPGLTGALPERCILNDWCPKRPYQIELGAYIQGSKLLRHRLQFVHNWPTELDRYHSQAKPICRSDTRRVFRNTAYKSPHRPRLSHIRPHLLP